MLLERQRECSPSTMRTDVSMRSTESEKNLQKISKLHFVNNVTHRQGTCGSCIAFCPRSTRSLQSQCLQPGNPSSEFPVCCFKSMQVYHCKQFQCTGPLVQLQSTRDRPQRASASRQELQQCRSKKEPGEERRLECGQILRLGSLWGSGLLLLLLLRLGV